MHETEQKPKGAGLLRRLRRDRAGNVLAIMAAALIPLCGFAGCAIDMARLYVVKVRLQQACDAGVLAGRKFMDRDPNVYILPGMPLTTATQAGAQAQSYFANNFTSSWAAGSWFTNNSQTFSPVTVTDPTDGSIQVSGTASATVPMTIMNMFGITSRPVAVSCQAKFVTPDTDVMFVLDNTGSMGCAVTDSDDACGGYYNSKGQFVQGWVNNSNMKQDSSGNWYVAERTSGGANVSRIDTLRQAVLAFYDTVQSKVSTTTHMRYGFAPYTSTVNVGPLIYGANSSYLVSSGSYQSRVQTGENTQTSNNNAAGTSASNCASLYNQSRTPATGYTSSGTATSKSATYSGGSTCKVTTTTYTPVWQYKSGVPFDVTKFESGATVTDPSKVTGATAKWSGCIEENTTAGSNPTASLSPVPDDINPAILPSSDSNRWTPMWPEVTYDRWAAQGNANTISNSVGDQVATMGTSANAKSGLISCPAAAKLLFLPTDTVSGRATISSYVQSLEALGGTYHDTGMIWGARMLSQEGIFQTNNSYPTNRAKPNKVIVFVTDGEMAPSMSIYGMYGVEKLDRRVTGTYFSGSDIESGSSNYADYVNYHNTRFLAACSAAKASPLKADIWVVAVAGSAVPSTLTSCASKSSQVLWAQTTDQLKSDFTQIANQVAMLRVSK